MIDYNIFALPFFAIIVGIGMIGAGSVRYQNFLLSDIDKALKSMNNYPILKINLWIKDPSFMVILTSNIAVFFIIILNNASLADLFTSYIVQVVIIGIFAILNLFCLEKFIINK